MKISDIRHLTVSPAGSLWQVTWFRHYPCCDVVSDERSLTVESPGDAVKAVLMHERAADAADDHPCLRRQAGSVVELTPAQVAQAHALQDEHARLAERLGLLRGDKARVTGSGRVMRGDELLFISTAPTKAERRAEGRAYLHEHRRLVAEELANVVARLAAIDADPVLKALDLRKKHYFYAGDWRTVEDVAVRLRRRMEAGCDGVMLPFTVGVAIGADDMSVVVTTEATGDASMAIPPKARVVNIAEARPSPGTVWATATVQCIACAHQHVAVQPMPEWAAAPISGQCPQCSLPHTCLPMHTPPASCNDGSARPWRGP